MLMKNKGKFVLTLLLAVLMMFGGVSVNALSPPTPGYLPSEYEIEVDNGTKVFRMIHNSQREPSDALVSGLYYNTDPRQIIYFIEPLTGTDYIPYFYERNLILSTDGMLIVNVVNVFFSHTHSTENILIEFFNSGSLTKAYKISDLVEDLGRLDRGMPIASMFYDESTNILYITTVDDLDFRFNIATGEVLSDTGETPSSWAQESIERAGDLGLLPDPFRSGFGRNTTRAEFAAIAIALYEYFREPVTGRRTFTDTTDTNVEKSAYLGIVSGVGNNRFDPDSPLTREQAAVMLSNLAEALGKPFPPWLMGLHPSAVLSRSMNDAGNISLWAIFEVAQVFQAGIMSGVGDNRFVPQQPYTREQSIVTIMRLYDWFTD